MEKFEPARSVSHAGSAVLRTAGWFAIWLLAAGAASAQVYPPGGYPGGGYPPGGYPNGNPGNYPSGPSIPIGRNKTNPKTSTKASPCPASAASCSRWTVRPLPSRSTTTARWTSSATTRPSSSRTGRIKNPQFAVGDQLSVEGPEDEKGYLIAVNVYWEKAAGAQTTATKDKDAGAVDTWKDNPKETLQPTRRRPRPSPM